MEEIIMIKQVRKRDGRIKDDDVSRVIKAVENAYNDVYEIYLADPKAYDMHDKMISDMDCIGTNFEQAVKYVPDEIVSVEFIQDLLVDCIESVDPYLARKYTEYRQMRTALRADDTKMLQSIKGIIDSTNHDVCKENANKKATLSSTQRDLIAGEVSKAIARQDIPQRLLDMHDKGKIHIHDMDYWMQGITNCELVNLKDMLENGTVINGKKIHTPHSIGTAVTLATQIAAQVASSTYGGQTMSISHLAPYVRASAERLIEKYARRDCKASDDEVTNWIEEDLIKEIRDAVQTFNYQINTIMTTNGQAPFVSLSMYINEYPGYEEETAMLIKEFLLQRLDGIENEYGVKVTQTFPKLLYFMDENNAYEGSEYFWLTELAAKCTAKRMNPDIMSVKKMKEVIGFAFPTMGCRAILSPFKDKYGDYKFYGRGNLGVQTINLPYLALEAKGDINAFTRLLTETFSDCVDLCQLRYDKLKGVKAKTAPILWQHGALARLDADDDILKAVDENGFTVTVGYSGLYETVKVLTGESHTSADGMIVAETIMANLEKLGDYYKALYPKLRIAIYGTPSESTTGKFCKAIKDEFGYIKDVTDKGYITNSYHVDVREEIDAFTKLSLESKLQAYSKGGAVSYIETYNMEKNVEAVLEIMQYMYETIMYAEINFESDTCGVCHYTGTMSNNPETLDWYCPQCGNDNQEKLSVVRRTCGYLGETVWTDGRKMDILNRVKHL